MEEEASAKPSVKIKGRVKTVKVDETVQLETEITPSQEDAVITFDSLQKEIATVDNKGVVTGKAKGIATVTATLGDSTDKITINVQDKEVTEDEEESQ